VTSIEHNHKAKNEAKKGDEVAVKIEPTSLDNSKAFGRHFDLENELVSKITRESINALKELYGSDLSQTDRQLILKLKGVFKIQ
jgi:translation initiation factor 5B